MSIDLATIPDASPPGTTLEIPLNTDPFPYQDLQAQGRYPQQATPDTLTNVLATMAAITNDGSNTGQTLWTDGQHRLLVNTGSSGAGAGPLGPEPWISNFPNPFLVTASGYYQISNFGFSYKWIVGGSAAIWVPTGQTLTGRGKILVGLGGSLRVNVPVAVFSVGDIDATTANRTGFQSMVTHFTIPYDFNAGILLDPNLHYISVDSDVSGIYVQPYIFAA